MLELYTVSYRAFFAGGGGGGGAVPFLPTFACNFATIVATVIYHEYNVVRLTWF